MARAVRPGHWPAQPRLDAAARHVNGQGTHAMSVQDIADKIKARVESSGFDRSVKFDTGADGVIVIDGATISTTDAPADCTIKLSPRRSGIADHRRSQPDDGVHDRQDQGRGRHVGRHGAEPAHLRLATSGGRAPDASRPCGRRDAVMPPRSPSAFAAGRLQHAAAPSSAPSASSSARKRCRS